YRTAEVEGPLGDPVQARYGLIDSGRTAVVEMASAAGLTLIPPERRDPRRTSTYGFGQLLEAVRRDGVATIIAGIGGSAHNGGGVAGLRGRGAAGGLGAGLVAVLKAALEAGAALVVEATGFDSVVAGADLVITGEGQVDEQTAFGKAPGEVAKRARKAGVPVLLLAGAKQPGWEALHELGVTAVVTMAGEGRIMQQALHEPARLLTPATVVACRRHSWAT